MGVLRRAAWDDPIESLMGRRGRSGPQFVSGAGSIAGRKAGNMTGCGQEVKQKTVQEPEQAGRSDKWVESEAIYGTRSAASCAGEIPHM